MANQPSTSETRVIAALHLARIAMAAAIDTATQELPDRIAAKRMDQARRLQRDLRLLERHLIEDMPGARHLRVICDGGMGAFAAQRFGAPLNLHSWAGLIMVTKATPSGDGRTIVVVPTRPEEGK